MKQKQGEDFIFIVGSPRSGTTWLQKLLACHEKMVTAQESDIFTSFIAPIISNYMTQLENPSGRGGTGLPCYLTVDELYEIMRLFIFEVIKKTNKNESQIFVEKTPSHALFIDMIHLVLPKAKFVHIVRDPRDVVSSLISISRSWGKNWAPDNVIDAAKIWRSHVNCADASLKKLRQELWFQLRYEDLKHNPKRILRHIFNFLGVKASIDDIEDILRNANQYMIHKYGEFAKRSGTIVHDPKGFVRETGGRGWKDDIGSIKGVFVFLFLKSEMRRYGYRW